MLTFLKKDTLSERMAKRVENRGGRREGSGRKGRTKISDNEVKKLIAAAHAKAKETGFTIADILIEMIYGGDKRNVLAAIRTYYENVVAKTSSQEITVEKTEGPSIGLPVQEEDPALRLFQGGKA